MASPETWIAAVKRELVRLDGARAEEMAGCSAEAIGAMLRAFPDVAPPTDYLAFMRELGAGSGNLFRGSDFRCADCLEMPDYLRECRAEDPQVPIGERFYFGHHQGYVLYFFKQGDGRVWCYELESAGEEVAARSFPAFVTDHLGIPAHLWAVFRRRDAQ